MIKPKLLLLEDDPNLSESVSEYLEDQGYEVICVYDASSAEDVLYEQRFDLLLLDVNVPGGDGFPSSKRAVMRGTQPPRFLSPHATP